MAKIYTKTGDKGETGLVNGKRVRKSSPRLDLYGEVDELNSRIGYSSSLMENKYQDITFFLQKIQSAIFDLGSNLACEAEFRSEFKLPQVSSSLIKELEDQIDAMDATLTPLKNFILPGGSLISSSLHLCRTSARNCERKLVTFSENEKEDLPSNGLIFLNRLSDYFFVLSRFVNKNENSPEILWKKSN